MDNVTYANTVRTATTLKDTDILVIQQRNSTESLSTTDFTQMKKITVTNLLQTTQKLQTNVEDRVAKFDDTGQTVGSDVDVRNLSLKSEIVNDLTHTETDKALSANMGKNLNDVKADKATTYTKTEVDVTIDELDNRLDTLEGTGAGSVKKAIGDLAGTGRTTETVKQNADNISAIKGTGYTKGSLKTHEDRLDTLDENKLNITDYNSDTDLEIGKIQFYFRYAVPTGYLLCDGSYISQTDYPKLYAQLMLVYNNCTNHGNLILDGDLKITLPNLTETKTSLLSATTPTEVGSAVSSSVSNMGISGMTSFIKPVMLLLPCIKCDN